jgi:DNA-directed RNA polymerase specialized sigma24 family protein
MTQGGNDEDDREDDDRAPDSGEREAGADDPRRGADPDAPDTSEPSPADDATDDEVGDAARATLEELRAFLARPETLARAEGIMRAKVPHQEVEALAGDAQVRALAAKHLPRAAKMQAWFDRICANVIADYWRKRAARKPHEGPMPDRKAAQPRDEAGLPIKDAGNAYRDIDASTDPRDDDDPDKEGWMLRRFLRGKVKGNPHEEQTLAMIEEWAASDEEMTYRELAKKHGITEDALYKRTQRLRDKYFEEYQRWRNSMFLLVGLPVAAALALVAYLLLSLWHRADPDPIRAEPPPPSAAPSATLAPTVEPFNQAAPTTPAPAPKGPPKPVLPPPRTGPKPPVGP